MTIAEVMKQRIETRKKRNDALEAAGKSYKMNNDVQTNKKLSDDENPTKRVTDNNETVKTAFRNGMPWTDE